MSNKLLILTTLVLVWVGLGQFVFQAEFALARSLASLHARRRTSAARARRGDFR